MTTAQSERVGMILRLHALGKSARWIGATVSMNADDVQQIIDSTHPQQTYLAILGRRRKGGRREGASARRVLRL